MDKGFQVHNTTSRSIVEAEEEEAWGDHEHDHGQLEPEAPKSEERT